MSLRSFTSLALLAAVLAGCGARSDLEPGAGSGSGSGATAPVCPQWVATQAAVQVSSIPSIIAAQAALATPSGVLVGYADEQLPAVDPTWHARSVGFGDGALGAEETVFQHDTGALGWTRISIAQGSGHTAATASDETQGMLFVPLDGTGAPQGSPVHVTSDEAHYLLATPSGYTALRSPWDPSGSLVPPISLLTLDVTGALVSSPLLIDASVPVRWFERFALAGGDFMIVWDETSTTSGCTGCDEVRGQRFSEVGAPLAPAVTLHAFGPQDDEQWVAAASPNGLLLVWITGGVGLVELVAEPFDADGSPAGPPQTFAQLSPQDSPVLGIGAAPGGDFVVAWVDGEGTVQGNVFVQSVGPDGTSEGPATLLGTLSPGPEEDVLVVASPLGAMVVYESDVPEGIEVFALPLACAP